MAELTVYEKPTCTTCRNLFTLLDERGVDTERIDYHVTGLTEHELRDLVRKTGEPASALFRARERVYEELELGDRDVDDDEAIRLMAEHPELMQRPVVVKGERAVLARPVERVLELLVAVLLALAVIAAAPSGATAAHKRRACSPKGSSTLVKTRAVRVFTRDDTVYGCLRSVGRSRELDRDDGLYSSVDSLRIAGRFVAWAYNETPACKADCPPGTTATTYLGVTDLRSGRRRTAPGEPQALVLTRFGAIAWLESEGAGRTVHAWDRLGQRVLDSGDIALSPFRLYGASVLWRNGAVGRWEELRR